MRSSPPRIQFPEILPPNSSLRVKSSFIPRLLWWISALFLILALLDIKKPPPKLETPISPPSNEGQAIYLVLDQSGSMEGTKMNTLKTVVDGFIQGRPSDLLGIVAFARTANVLVPLTLDHSLLLDSLKDLKAIQDPMRNGTAIGYAIYKTAGLIAATKQFMKGTYDLKGSAIVLVTDGLQDPNALDNENSLRNQDIPEAAAFAKENEIHLYIINIDPTMSLDQYTAHRNQMRKAAESTGGEFYLADDSETLKEVFEAINRLEKSVIPPPPLQPPGESTAPIFILLSLLTLFLAIFLETTLFRKVPA